ATSASATTCRAAPASPCSGPRLGAAPKPSLASGPAYTLDARGQRNGHHAGEVAHVIHQGLRVLGAGGVEGLLVFDIDVHRAQEGRVAALRRDGPAHLEAADGLTTVEVHDERHVVVAVVVRVPAG